MDIRLIDDLSTAKLSLPKKTETTNAFGQIYSQKLSAVSAPESQPGFDAKKDLIDQSNRVLDLLDEYANELKNPEKSLKEIDPLLKTIEKEVGLVEARAADPIYGDDDIGGVVRDLALTANVALFKFHRGDFIN
jgi:hypothetical protein